jgi:hypothetical protein
MHAQESLADFDLIDWQAPAPGVRFKAICRGGVQLRVVEFSREFIEIEWCEKKHFGFVLSGELKIEFPTEAVVFRQGQGLMLPGGVGSKHKASAVTPSVTLFLVEDA